jgi:hypothetical protein
MELATAGRYAFSPRTEREPLQALGRFLTCSAIASFSGTTAAVPLTESSERVRERPPVKIAGLSRLVGESRDAPSADDGLESRRAHPREHWRSRPGMPVARSPPSESLRRKIYIVYKFTARRGNCLTILTNSSDLQR